MPIDVTEKYAIKIVPISFIIDGHSYRDGVDITPGEVCEVVASNQSLPTTTSPSPGEFLQSYRELRG